MNVNVMGRWAIALVGAAGGLLWADGITAEQRAEYWRARNENAEAQSVVQQIRAVAAQLPKAQQDAAEKQKALSAAYDKLQAGCKAEQKDLVADAKGEPDCVAGKPAPAPPQAAHPPTTKPGNNK
jgi:hypothetical protein